MSTDIAYGESGHSNEKALGAYFLVDKRWEGGTMYNIKSETKPQRGAKTMIDLFNLTPADIGILAAALDEAAHLGDDDAVDALTWAARNEIGLEESKAEELAYTIVHKVARRG